MLKQEMGKRIEDLREKRGITRERLAEISGISTKFLYEVERGKKGLSAETLLKITSALSCSSDYILRGEKIEKRMVKINYPDVFNRRQIKKLEEIISLIYEICENKKQ